VTVIRVSSWISVARLAPPLARRRIQAPAGRSRRPPSPTWCLPPPRTTQARRTPQCETASGVTRCGGTGLDHESPAKTSGMSTTKSKNSFLPGTWARRLYEHAKARRKLAAWEKAGRPVPPPHAIKVRCVLAVADLIGADTLVETGTNYGAMLAATSHHFRLLHSIELDARLAAMAKQRFARWSNIHIHEGDSAAVLPRLIAELPKDAAVFWLDGHYSGAGTAKGSKDTPILEELSVIAQGRDHRDAIIIDDARLFGGDASYPTLATLQERIAKQFGSPAFVTPHDALVILPGAVDGTTQR